MALYLVQHGVCLPKETEPPQWAIVWALMPRVGR